VCPRCRQNAPIVYRGVAAYCTACGAPRVPLASSSVTLAGQPSKVGGTVTRVFGWIVLGIGWATALLLGGLLLALFPEGMAWLVVGLPIAFVSSLFGYLLLRSGRGLQELGTGEQKSARTKAIFALAQNRRGMVTARDAAQALDIRPEEADALLTELAKTAPDQVVLEIDDAGGVFYRFPAMLTAWQGHETGAGARAGDGRVRVDATGTSRVAADASSPSSSPNAAAAAEAELLEADVIPPRARARQER
jgi:hypothetical protein